MASANPKVRVGVGAFVLQSHHEDPSNPRFLVGKRLNAHGGGSFATPGGHLEYGETPEQCAERELMEETGLKVKNVRFLTATNDFMPAETKHYITLFMVCERADESVEPQVLEPEKCAGWEWVCWADLVQWVKENTEAKEGQVVGKKLFTPFLSLIAQRREAMPRNL